MHFEIQWHVSQQTSWLHVLMQLFWFPLFFMVYLASIVSTHATNTPPPLTIAVASNFYAPLKKICTNFTQETGIQVRLSNGSTGNLRRQIQHGAPYDLFFSADSKRPIQLEKKKLTDLRFSYAFGKLAVWSIKPDSITPDLNTLDINNANLRFLAIANPKVAPYGIAAKEVLQHFNLYQPLKQEKKLVTGENIGKTFHYIKTGNAQIGVIAYSQVSNQPKYFSGKIWLIPEHLYSVIEQQAVVLQGKAERAEVKIFLQYFNRQSTQDFLIQQGYTVPKRNL
jgi:molybdate transport system substrate-binding protein